MKFLVDANLPPALAHWLVSEGYEALHVYELGMGAKSDREIWQHACEIDACVVTKDEDFVLLSAFNRAGPAIVWIRIRNAVRRALLSRLLLLWPEVMNAIERGEKVIEVR